MGILLIPLAAVIAPLLAALVSRAILVPLVVFEIGLGMLLGPAGLGWVQDSDTLDVFSQLGLALLFFMAGNEINLDSVRGKGGVRALAGWGGSAVLALVAGFFLGGGDASTGVIIAIALSGTALGTLTPILRDAGLTSGPVGNAVAAAGAVGEFLPLVAISIFLSGRQPLAGVISLVVFLAVAGFAFATSARSSGHWLQRMVTRTLHTSGQFAVRVVILILAALVVLAVVLDVDFLLGAFTAGLLARVVLRGSSPAEQHIIEAKLESIAFGFFVPLFFVTTGVAFPLATLLADPASLALVPLVAVAILVIRGVPGFLSPERGVSFRDRTTVGLFTATTLPLVIAVTEIGTDAGVLDASLAGALVGGAMVTVLLFPMLALVGRARSVPAEGAEVGKIDDDPLSQSRHE
ncbi:Kef-type K+ transport system membrane component KefB [Leifsonia sp. AK011]|uniref:cation:proton antiporter n=1 Tax=Leifsonia sp. AK011 TaxID=2723075 RepID=UPI00179C450B|nr:cation:proton antiporter [Leifsonia sp. AK011]NYF11279.1 Kef-type K+ transport system membrane component KefB [Leifsonia sp. AK011]